MKFKAILSCAVAALVFGAASIAQAETLAAFDLGGPMPRMN